LADTIAGDASTTATINVGGTVNGNLDFVGDHDWFAITLTAGQAVTINLSGVGQGGVTDPYLYLRDSAGNLLASNDDIVDGTNRNSQLNFNPSYTGTYYVDVGAWNEQYTGTYQVSVKPYTPPPLAPTTRSPTSWFMAFGAVRANTSTSLRAARSRSISAR